MAIELDGSKFGTNNGTTDLIEMSRNVSQRGHFFFSLPKPSEQSWSRNDLRPSHPPGSSMHRLEYPDPLQVLTPRRVYDMLAKVYSARGDMPGEDLLPAQEASSKSNTCIK